MKQSAISKSAIMKRAWSIFRSGHNFYASSFRRALERAWEVEKDNTAYRAEQKRIAEQEAWYNENKEAVRAIIYTSFSVSRYYED